MNLFLKECNLIRKSLVYIMFVFLVIVFFVSQFGSEISDDLETIKSYKETNYSSYTGNDRSIPTAIKPVEGSEDYGTKTAEVPDQIMQMGMEDLIFEYLSNDYGTYPILFYKNVKLNNEQQSLIASYIEEITGVTDLQGLIDSKYILADEETAKDNVILNNYGETGEIWIINPDYKVPILVSYERFNIIMSEVCEILGGGSKYEAENLVSESGIPKTYEDKMQEYNDFVFTDKVSGAYARLFADYLGLAIAMFTVFVPVSFLLRDKKTKMAELVYSRKASSTKIIFSKYFAMVAMIMIPVYLLSIYPTIQCFGYNEVIPNLEIDIFAFAKYITAWILPSAMVLIAVAFILTTVADNSISIIACLAWVFADIGGSHTRMQGGNYGTELVIRHNIAGNFQQMQSDINALIINRLSYAILAVLLVAACVYIYELKRRGKINVSGKLQKLFKNSKRTDKVKPHN